jgi:TonB family protein
LLFVTWSYIAASSAPRLAALPLPDAPPPPAPPIIQPEAKREPPPPPDFANASKPPPRDDSGEAIGHGTANRSTPGDRPMESAAGLEQANLTRDTKADAPIRPDESLLPAQPGAAVGDDSVAQATPSFGVPEPSPTPAPLSKPRPSPPIAMADPTPGDRPQPVAEAPPPPKANVLGSPTGARDVPPSPVTTPPTTPQAMAGHTSIASDTDSLPFARASSAHFHNGKMDARQGRRVKTTRIDIDLAGRGDLTSIGSMTVVLGVVVDPAGFVKDVVILHSSGSDFIDLPCQRAVYNWWFEPEKDKDGKPLPDKWVVTID